MKTKLSLLLFVFTLLVSSNCALAKCTGKFVNPLTDICWDCIFPISIGNVKSGGKNPDTDNPSNPICMCSEPFPRVGVSVGFWEPVRMVDVTRSPFCFPSLGGISMDPGLKLGTGTKPRSTGSATAFWHVHWYIYPLIYWLELLTDFICLEHASFDIAYLTEFDPMWGDDSLTAILNPEAALFGNLAAQTACAADCAAATLHKPMDKMFWCAGCQGSIYPLSGHFQGYVGDIQSSLNAVERFSYKLHRELIEWGTAGKKGQCGKYPMPVMQKSQYRSQLTVPIPSDCYPFGAATNTYESGKTIPVTGEDYGYLIWRKRNCCAL